MTSFGLNVIEHGKLKQRLQFRTSRARRSYMDARSQEVIKNKLQYNYKRGEYLRVYKNAKVFLELDIVNVKSKQESAREQLERLFNDGKTSYRNTTRSNA